MKIKTTSTFNAQAVVEDARFGYGCYKHLTGPAKGDAAGSGIHTGSLALPSVRGLRWRCRMELVGANPEACPQPSDYVPNWANDEAFSTAKRYFKSRREQRQFPKASKHMRDVLTKRKEAKRAYEQAMTIWKQALALPFSQPTKS